MRGWQEGVLAKTINSVGGTSHYKGDIVRYKRYTTVRDIDGFRLTKYEWHVINANNNNLIRVTELHIEGKEVIKEKILY